MAMAVRAYCSVTIVQLLVSADLTESMIQNKTVQDVKNNLREIDTRRFVSNKRSLSTSSESGDHKSDGGSGSSLGITSDSWSSSAASNNANNPKSSVERRGWRKWHRKCPPCPNDMIKKWRDRSIQWICGGYQRARRSFKSDCMMHYRNCQDGTMFVKVHDNRCSNDTSKELRHGLHFFYEYGRDSQDSKSSSRSASTSIHISSEFAN